MRKTMTFGIALALAAVGFAGCNDANDNRANVNGPNTVGVDVVGTNNVPNSNINGVNVNLPNVNTTAADTSDSATDDKAFMTRAAESGMAEVRLGQMAQQKSSNAEVKQFAQRMVTDHTKANNELKQIAQKENVTLPTEPSAKHKELMDKLQKLSGAEFDREYMKTQVEDHQTAVNLFKNEADGGSNANVKAFASKTLPTLKEHLQMARDINGKLK